MASVAILLLIVAVSFTRRAIVDSHNIITDATTVGITDREYQAHPVLAYLHIIPGMAYLFGAPLQLSYRFRSKHHTFHRRLGRVLLPAGFITGFFAVAFGVRYAVGGAAEGAATTVFGLWFIFCLIRALVAIRSGDIATHRRFMIRAFVIGIGIGSIRIGIAALAVAGLPVPVGYAISFWIAFTLHLLIGEWWIRRFPTPGTVRPGLIT